MVLVLSHKGPTTIAGLRCLSLTGLNPSSAIMVDGATRPGFYYSHPMLARLALQTCTVQHIQ